MVQHTGEEDAAVQIGDDQLTKDRVSGDEVFDHMSAIT